MTPALYTTMFKLLVRTGVLVLGMTLSSSAMTADVTGAGATFPYAVYTKWAEAYRAKTGNTVNYQGLGSSGGIKQIKARTVDFGATDAPLPEAELRAEGLVQFPAVMGGATLVFNLPGIESGQLRLDGPTAADIFSGVIQKWNDSRISSLNPGLRLPASAITIAHRSDGSGTTDVVTNYFAKQSKNFLQRVGVGKTVNWPVNGVGGKGNPGVAAVVRKIVGTIGYVDYADAKKNNMAFVALKNKAGNFVVPSLEAFEAAASSASFKPGQLTPDLLDRANTDAWPIFTASYILMHQSPSDVDRSKSVLDFFSWSLSHGQQMAEELGFVALPEAMVKVIEDQWKQSFRDPAGRPIWQ